MEPRGKQQVRKNRQRIRSNLRNCLISTSQQYPDKTINSSKSFTPQTVLKRRRKSSEDIITLDDVSYLKQIYLQNPFDHMFELLQKIGQGSHSIVYKCKQIKSGKVFAIKIFKFIELQSIQAIKQHYRIKKTLCHENIIKAYYLFINQKLKKIDMICQYCPYHDLRQFFNQNKKIPQPTISYIVYSIVNGVAYLHKHGVCHRDIKPENILYNHKTGQLKIIDFQLAKMCKYTNQRLQMWTNTGTLHYKAPQMFKGSYNESIDMWAIGIITYQMVFKKLPFKNQYLCDTITAICEYEPEYQSIEVNPFLLHFIKRCLTKNPLKRITSIQALKTPFLLKRQQGSNSPKLKKRQTPNTDNQQETDKREQKMKIQLLPKTSFSEDDLLNQKSTFSEDIGIRFTDH